MAKFSLSDLHAASQRKTRKPKAKPSKRQNRMSEAKASEPMTNNPRTMKIVLQGAILAGFGEAELAVIDQAVSLICQGEAFEAVGAIKDAIAEGDSATARAEVEALASMAEGRSSLPKATRSKTSLEGFGRSKPKASAGIDTTLLEKLTEALASAGMGKAMLPLPSEIEVVEDDEIIDEVDEAAEDEAEVEDLTAEEHLERCLHHLLEASHLLAEAQEA